MNWIIFLKEKIYRIYILFLHICEKNTEIDVSSFLLPVTKPYCLKHSWVQIYRERFMANNKERFTAEYSLNNMSVKQFRADWKPIRGRCVYKVSIKVL